jgi:inner membrane protein
MDSITHAVAGAVIARAVGDEKLGPWGTVAGLAMGFFPDTDFLLGLINRRFYLEYHRQFTHSLLLLPLYALFFSWLFVRLSKRPFPKAFFLVSSLALASHVFFDLLTSYGTMILAPFFKHRFAFDLLFIIDLFFSAILVLPWGAGFIWKGRARLLAQGSLIGLAAYILFCSIQHYNAIGLGRDFASTLGEKSVAVAALPEPFSPFRWASYVETPSAVYQGFVDLVRQKKRDGLTFEVNTGSGLRAGLRKLDRLFDPPGEIRYRSWPKLLPSPWVQKAIDTDGVRFYYWFARFPVVSYVNTRGGLHRVEFTDLRFLIPGVRLPFVYFVEMDGTGTVVSEGFLDDNKR